MKKRIASMLTASALLVGCLTGCSTGKDSTNTADKTTEQTAFTPKLDTEMTETLEIAGFMGNFEALDEVINEFNEFYPNVTFTYEQNTGYMMPQYLAANPNIDLFMTNDRNIRESDMSDYFVQDSCVDLSAENMNTDALNQDAVAYCTVDGKLYRLPIAMQTYGMVVNKTLLENEGVDVPTNYQEFLDALKTLKDKGYTPLQGSQKHLYGDLVVNMAMDTIAQDESLQKALAAKDASSVEKMQTIFERLETIMTEGYTDYELNCTYPSDNYDGSIMAFFEGDMPFYVCSAECVSGMKKRESKSEAFTANPFDYQFMYVPMGDDGVYAYTEPWYGFSVNKNSEQKDLAVEFLRFMSTKLDIMASIKGLPSVVADGEVDAKYTEIINPENAQESFCNDGSVAENMRMIFLDVAKKFGAGEYQNAQQAAEAFAKQETPTDH